MMMGDLAERMGVLDWLRGKHGKREMTLPSPVQEGMILTFDKDTFRFDNVPARGDSVNSSEKAFWLAVFGQMQADNDPEYDYTGRGFLNFMLWMELGSEVLDVDVGPSAVCSRDIEKHGFESPSDLVGFSVAIWLGRVPTADDCKGAAHGTPPQSSAGAKAALKANLPTFGTELVRTTKTNNLSPLEVHFNRMLEKLSISNASYAAKASFRFNRWWMGVKRANSNDVAAIILYVTEYFSLYAGRGIPVEHDSQIQAAVASQRLTILINEKAEQWSGVKRAASESAPSELKALAQQVAELAAVVKSLGANDHRVPLAERKCYYCGDIGHQIADCPRKA
jgi:hypothetical protein